MTLTEMCVEHCKITHIDYLNIDTEGNELQVLQGIDFSRMRIEVIGIENNYPDKFAPIHQLLIDNGYEIAANLSHDLMYKKK